MFKEKLLRSSIGFGVMAMLLMSSNLAFAKKRSTVSPTQNSPAYMDSDGHVHTLSGTGYEAWGIKYTIHFRAMPPKAIRGSNVVAPLAENDIEFDSLQSALADPRVSLEDKAKIQSDYLPRYNRFMEELKNLNKEKISKAASEAKLRALMHKYGDGIQGFEVQ
jgi:hypothetical protein